MSQPEASSVDAIPELIERLGRAMASAGSRADEVAGLAGGAVRDDGAPLGARAEATVPGVESVTVTRRWDSDAPNAAEIQLTTSVPLADLEPRLGPTRPVPQAKPGARRVRFGGSSDGAAPAGDDAPSDAAGWTVYAVLDGDDAARSIMVRCDA